MGKTNMQVGITPAIWVILLLMEGDPMDDTRKQTENEQTEKIIELGSDVTKGSKGNIYTLTIIGQIEGHQVLPDTAKTTKYEHVLPLLAGIEESDEIEGLLLLLNTVGGDIEAGLAIAEMIAGMKKPTVSLVLGGGHSIGIPLAVCTKKSFITPTASMTVHPVRMTGLVVGAPQTFRYFQRIQEQIAHFVTENSGISKEQFERYMMATGEMATDVGTILYGKQAVASGLIDKLGGLNDALTALRRMIDKKRSRKHKE
jgi:ATP-dependent protease ClpP protease subunit